MTTAPPGRTSGAGPLHIRARRSCRSKLAAHFPHDRRSSGRYALAGASVTTASARVVLAEHLTPRHPRPDTRARPLHDQPAPPQPP